MAAASTTRTQATNAGDMPPSTATLMNRYGIPHRTDMAAKPAQARALIPPRMAEPRSGAAAHARVQPDEQQVGHQARHGDEAGGDGGEAEQELEVSCRD